ncbi:MAG: hypothetical protein ACXV3U_02915 [Halobacteriota archaeon]
MDDVAFMDYTAFVTPSLVERVLVKYHVEALVDAHELAHILVDTAEYGIYRAYYFLKESGVDAPTVPLITGDIHRLNVGHWVDWEWEPEVLRQHTSMVRSY